MYNPVSTYRIQFHKDFTFKDLKKVLPYLKELGIKTIYASPVLAAAPGSTHGYDGINPNSINPEIGTVEELREISADLRAEGIGWLQDIVPNHMAFHPENAMLMSVLEHGKDSPYASYFDIAWESGEKLMVPFLGASLEEVIKNGELKLVAEGSSWFFDYSGNRFPLNAASYAGHDELGKGPAALKGINGDTKALLELTEQQHYRLCHWQETDKRINYRRFFTVNGLICLNIQDEKVFEEIHRLIASLQSEGAFSGLRIDHIDGLYNPAGYLQRLRKLTGPSSYTVVEKILEPGESLPADWPVQGNTGYDFLSLVNNLFTQRKSRDAFTQFYQKITGDKDPVELHIHAGKDHILTAHMQGELDNLAKLFLTLNPRAGDQLIKPVIAALLVRMPVYRFYGDALPLAAEEATALRGILRGIVTDMPALKQGVSMLMHALFNRPEEGDPDYNQAATHFYKRCMQFSGPLMAKGVEDTVMYTYHRFIGHNDVGDAPDSFGISREEFHKAMMERQDKWPLSLNATSTHDTKRGEDARALLNVLTDVPDDWFAAVGAWRVMNAGLKMNGMPDTADEYFIYQTIFATYPFTQIESAQYGGRLREYLQKALREGKRRSDWASPDEAYESATISFATQLLEKDSAFFKSFTAFREGLQDYGMLQGLAQLLIRFTAPGVPDVYQGTELWDLSLVDPDNRRPVDYRTRSEWLDGLSTGGEENSVERLWEERVSGRIKLWLCHQLLSLRRNDPELFSKGHYVPLRISGKYKDHVMAFGRRYDRRWIVLAVPLHLAETGKEPLRIDWKNTQIHMPSGAPDAWRHLLGEGQGTHTGAIAVKDIFSPLPFAVLRMEQPENSRSAGVLMPVTALPASFSIGDLGPEARRFAKSLSRAGQRYWQVLPLNPVSEGSGYSPYSSISTMAGNTLLISPEMLADEGLVTEEELAKYCKAPASHVNYAQAQKHKTALLQLAYARYKAGASGDRDAEIRSYHEKESAWLDDFALYVIIRRVQDEKPWYEWPAPLRKRDRGALEEFRKEHMEEIEEVIWQQALFSRQWTALRQWCNSLGVQLIGDLPFYASYDSADVWTHPEIFSVDSDGKMTGVAGVPPDYFSETGQLWGMPTFRWDVLEKDSFRWWIERLRKNLQLYDLLRIDHFRALAAYWQVPAGEETAVNGAWIPGPGTRFFDAVLDAFGGLPFIAEDLGDNMDDVYTLRDDVGLPGMKVMQFAFGDNHPISVDAPHNYGQNFVAYTGTHDNNTTLGWFRKEVKTADRQRLSEYVNTGVNAKNVVGIMAKLVYGSVAKMAILPVQDVLGLDESARMNTPSSGKGNWGWRLKPGQLGDEHVAMLRRLAQTYNRL